MFNQDPALLIPTAYLASDRLFYFALNEHSGVKNHIDLATTIKLAAKDYPLYFNGRLRDEDIAHAVTYWLPDTEKYEFSCLQKLGDEFLIWQGNRFEVRSERLEAWLMLCSLMDPAWIIASAYQQLMTAQVISPHDLIEILTQNQCPFALPSDNLTKQYADNHVHFNGHGYTSLSMLDISLSQDHQTKKQNWPRRDEYTLFESGRLDKALLPLWVSSYANSLQSAIYLPESQFHFPDIAMLETLQATKPDNHQNILGIIEHYVTETAQQRILQQAHRADFHGHHRWLLFCCGLMMGQPKTEYQCCLANFIRVSNILRNYMVVSGVGLGQFVKFFGFKLRHPRLSNQKSQQESIHYDLTPAVSREFRVSPDFVIGEKKQKQHVHLPMTELMTFIKQHQQLNLNEQTHLVVHFTRGLAKENGDDKRIKKFRASLLNQVRKLQGFSASVGMSDVNINQEIGKEERRIDIRKFIRGYDVAGNENELPIEVFAPALRVLRAAKYHSTSEFSTRLQKPFITVHAGEDYSHLLSGLRAVDEAVEFCQLRDGDRIGHGLALGVDVQAWAKRQHRAYLTVGQHLDNLVWCYHQSVQLSQYTNEHIPVMHLLREKIHFWCAKVWNDDYSANDLYQAWLWRRNWPDYQEMKNEAASGSEWVPDAEHIDDVNHKKVKQLWQNYLDSSMFKNQIRFNQVISVDCVPEQEIVSFLPKNNKSDFVSQGELRLYEAIQDFLMEKYSRLGIVLEACPTSNIYIGRFTQYHEHPIFRWNPPNQDWLKLGEKYNRYGLRSGPMTVCINTDDCALMPTTIANEHRIIKETAIQYFGVNTLMADLWITAIRDKGVEIFQYNHLNQKR